MSNQSRQLFAIYCDDVRQEIGNKRTYVGVYTGDLVVAAELPVVLPKLAIVANVYTPKDEPFKKLQITVTYGDKVLLDTFDLAERLSAEQSSETAITTSRGAEDPIETERMQYWSYQFEFVLSPFMIDAARRLRVTATTESGEINSRALRILTVAAPTNP